MKKLIASATIKRMLVIFIMITGVSLFQPQTLHAQVQVNISLQPLWGPVEYDYVDYYYFPAYEVYYYVPQHRFYYLDGGRWLFANSLPSRYGRIDYYTTYKVVVNEPRAYMNFNSHKVKYAEYKGGGHKQMIIRDSHEQKAFASAKSTMTTGCSSVCEKPGVRQVYCFFCTSLPPSQPKPPDTPFSASVR